MSQHATGRNARAQAQAAVADRSHELRQLAFFGLVLLLECTTMLIG